MKTRTGISDLEYPDGRMAHTDVEKAELLNVFFSNVFTKEDLATIPTFDQRERTNQMATPLKMIFTRSIHEGQLPPSWKEANVTPVYTKGKRHIPGNYRPVSLTSMAGKWMERLIRDSIMTHMTEHDLISPKQHGFIQGRSCVTQLLDVGPYWTHGRSSRRGGKHRHLYCLRKGV